MAATTRRDRTPPTVGDLLDALGVPAGRVRLDPPPGRATERDWVDQHVAGDRPCELVAGTLVEKPMGWREGWLGSHIFALIREYVVRHNLGVMVGDGGPYRLVPGLIRLPDAAFVSWDRFPDGPVFESPERPYIEVAPDLAVEVISESNTAREMGQKLGEYFKAGVRLVWYVEPDRKEVGVYTSPKKKATVGLDGVLDGGKVLPGFTLPVAAVFDYPARPAPRGKKRPR
ncbi:MAG: Uma2 family endonuclease [Gemmataceae bacterium]|nr:Uma2 family endonuclease [Gemmataceae bacterium]